MGDFILAKATQVLASIGNPEVILLLAQVIRIIDIDTNGFNSSLD